MLGIDLVLDDLALGFFFHAGLCQDSKADVDYLVGSESVDLFQVIVVVQVEVVEELKLHLLPFVVLINQADPEATWGHHFLL